MIKSNHFLAVAMMVVSLLLAGQTHAVPAHPAAVKVRQPDGTTITVCLHGDGYTILKNPEGYYVYATLADGRLQPTPWIAHNPAERADDEQTFLRGVSRHTRPDRKSLPGPAGIEGLRRAAPSHTSYNTENGAANTPYGDVISFVYNSGTAPVTIPGDVNGDGSITAADVTALYDYLLNNDTTNVVNGDQTGDGIITAADVTAVYTILLE